LIADTDGVIGGCNTGGYSPPDNTSSVWFGSNVVVVPTGRLTSLSDTITVWAWDNNTYWVPPGDGGNLTWPNRTSWAAWQAAGYDGNGGIDDPLIADPAGGNWTLLPSSPAWQRGWEPIDQSQWGPVPL
jgi:hypothetical protein